MEVKGMTVTTTQAQKILTGNSTFSQLGFSMLLTRLKGVYAKDPSPASLQKCAQEINAFLQKYAPIMTSDFAIISKL
jgi:hypothetical protein